MVGAQRRVRGNKKIDKRRWKKLPIQLKQPIRILVFNEKNPTQLGVWREVAQIHQLDMITLNDVGQVKKILEEKSVDILVVDWIKHNGEKRHVEILKMARKKNSKCIVIVVSGYVTDEMRTNAIEEGFDFIEKRPISVQEKMREWTGMVPEK